MKINLKKKVNLCARFSPRGKILVYNAIKNRWKIFTRTFFFGEKIYKLTNETSKNCPPFLFINKRKIAPRAKEQFESHHKVKSIYKIHQFSAKFSDEKIKVKICENLFASREINFHLKEIFLREISWVIFCLYRRRFISLY